MIVGFNAGKRENLDQIGKKLNVNYHAGDEKPDDIWSWHYSIEEQGAKAT